VKLERRQNAFDFLSEWLKPGWEFKAFTEAFRRLVDAEPGRIGGQLEQHAAGLPEVNGVKVAPVDE
jgi:hypothetical protein